MILHRLHITKRTFAFIILIMFLISLVPLSLNADAAYTIYNQGSWWDNKQAIRISIYNRINGICESTMDFFYDGNLRKNSDGTTNEGSYKALREDYAAAYNSGYDIVICQGCKIDYLEDYYNDPNKDIADLSLRQINAAVLIENAAKTSSRSEDVLRGMSPLYYLDTSGNYYYYSDEYSFSKYFKDLKGDLFQWFFSKMGYYFYETEGTEDRNLTFLDTDYVVIFEPVYWFVDYYHVGYKEVFFYGSATEWAIYSQQNMGRYVIGESEGYSVHSAMGTLTAVAGPLSCTPTEERKIEFGNGREDLLFNAVSAKRNTEVRKWWSNRRKEKTASAVTSINRIIVEELGVDILFPDELYDMSIEIQNTNFFTETQGILSFKVETNGKLQLAPSYNDIESGGNYYGMKLTLETLPGSDIRQNDIEIYSDGIPEIENVSSVVTYVYDMWYTGTTSGIWKFAVHVDSPTGKVRYKSNSGVPIDSENEYSDYAFTITVSNLRSIIRMPDNTKSSDKAPNGFWQPSGDMSGYTPKHEASWNTYVASAWKTAEGEEKVFLTKKDFTKSITMSGTTPVCYPNIASAYMDRNGELVTKSGYGIGIDGHYTVDGGGGGFQNGVVLYPEYGYGLVGSLMEPNGSSGMYLEQNSYSKYYRDARNSLYSRVHFTPIWYPDGEYNVQVFMFDCWTPVGMLWDCQKYTVHINGTMYDDWYVTRN